MKGRLDSVPLALKIRFLSNLRVLDCIGLTVYQNASLAFLAFVGRVGAAVVERTIVVVDSVVDTEGGLNLKKDINLVDGWHLIWRPIRLLTLDR